MGVGKRNNGRKLFFDKKGMISPLSHDSPSNAPITGSSIYIGCIISILKRRRSDLIEKKSEMKNNKKEKMKNKKKEQRSTFSGL